MADKTTIAVEVEVKGVEQSIESVKDLKNAIKAAKDEQVKAASVFGESSKEFVAASKKVSALKDKVDDLADSTKSLKGSGIERANEGFSQLGEGLKNLDFDKVKVGLTAMKSAFAAVGIGLIVQLVSYLIENFDELSKGSGGLAKALRFVGDIIGQIIAMGTDLLNFVTDFIGLTSESERAMEAQGEAMVNASKKSKEALAEQVKGFDNQIAAAKAAGKDTVQLEIAKQEAIIETNKKIAEQIIAFVASGGQLTDEQKKLFDESVANIKAAKQAESLVTITANKQTNDKIAEQNKAAAEKKKAFLDKRNEEYLKSQEDELAALKKRLLDEDLLRQQQRENELFLDETLRAEKYKKRLLDAELNALNNKEDVDAQIALLEAKRQIELQNLELTSTERAIINKKYADQEDELAKAAAEKALAIEKATEDAKFKIAQNSVDSLQGLSDMYFLFKTKTLEKGSAAELEQAKKQFNINKALQIASATIAGIQGVQNALMAESILPEPLATVLRISNAVAVGIASASSISKIAASKFDAGGGGATGGGGGAAPMPSIPAPPTIATSSNNTNQSTTFDESGKNLEFKQPQINVTATVGVDEIASKSNRVSVLENQSTF